MNLEWVADKAIRQSPAQHTIEIRVIYHHLEKGDIKSLKKS